MKTVSRFIYYSSLVFIGLCLIIYFLLKITPLQFSSSDYEEGFERISLIGIPIAILLTLFRLGFTKELNKSKSTNRIISTISIAFLFFLGVIIYAFTSFNLCDTTTGKTLFIKKANHSQRIVEREFGCGAVDSGPATITIRKITEITPFFIYITKVDTITIDRDVWQKVNEE